MRSLFVLPLASLFLTAAPARAQAPFEAAYRGGGPMSDVGEAVAVGDDGSFAVVGTFEGTATFDGLSITAADAPAARSDVFVVRYAPDGTAQWARRGGTGVFNDFAGGVAIAPDGSVVVSGYFTGIATFDGGANPDTTLTTRSDFDAFVLKYSAAGDLLWVEQGGGTQQDTGRGVTVDADGFIYATGSFTGVGQWADTLLTSTGSTDVFLVKYAPNGALVWVRRAGGTDGDDGRDVAVNAAGNAFIAGTFRGVALFDALPIQSRGLSDLFVARYDAGGSAQWVEGVGGGGNDYGRGLALSYFESDVYVTGSFEETILVGDDVLTSDGFSDIVLASLATTDGELLWGVRGGGAGFDIGNDVGVARWFDYDIGGSAPIITGYVDGDATFDPAYPGGTITLEGHRGFTDGFVAVVLDAGAGWYYSAHSLGGSNADRGYGIALGGPSEGQGVLTGAFRGTGDFGGLLLESAGSNDVYAVTFENCSLSFCSVATEPSPPSQVAALTIAPNPFRERTAMTLTLDAPGAVRVEVLDGLGRRVALLHDGVLGVGRHAFALDGARLAPGVYAVRATGAGIAAMRRLVRVR